jgi:LPS-assembly lipoprotein
MKKIAWISGFAIFLTGCGFHLRGVEHFPPPLRSMMIETKHPNTPMMLKLRSDLKNNGVVLVENRQDALTILSVSDVRMDDQAVSLLGAGQASIHRLTDTLTYTLRDALTGQILFGPKTIRVSQHYSTNASLILSNEYVANDIGERLQEELAAGVFDGLSRAKLPVRKKVDDHETSAS